MEEVERYVYLGVRGWLAFWLLGCIVRGIIWCFHWFNSKDAWNVSWLKEEYYKRSLLVSKVYKLGHGEVKTCISKELKNDRSVRVLNLYKNLLCVVFIFFLFFLCFIYSFTCFTYYLFQSILFYLTLSLEYIKWAGFKSITTIHVYMVAKFFTNFSNRLAIRVASIML